MTIQYKPGYARMAGRETIRFNNSVFLAMREHSDRNFALAYQLKVGVYFLTDVMICHVGAWLFP